MSSRGGYGGAGRGGGGGRRSDQPPGPVAWPALQSSGALGGRGRGNAGRGNAAPVASSSSSPPSDAVSGAIGAVDVASSSSSVREKPKASASSDSGSSLGQELAEKVQITTAPPSSSKAVTFPVRPGFGQAGKKVTIRANHFLVQVADRDLYHYDVISLLRVFYFIVKSLLHLKQKKKFVTFSSDYCICVTVRVVCCVRGWDFMCVDYLSAHRCQ